MVLADFNLTKAEEEAAAIRAEGGSATALAVDVADEAAVHAMMASAGPVDILVNNAYTGDGPRRLETKEDAIYARAMAMSFWAAKWTMVAALPHMKAQGWGRVINMASLNGVNAHMGSADYNAAKEALRAFTRTATYTYDNNGNRTMSVYATGVANRTTSDGVWDYGYDAEGNVVSKERISDGRYWEYVYDHRNQLTQAVEYVADGGSLALAPAAPTRTPATTVAAAPSSVKVSSRRVAWPGRSGESTRQRGSRWRRTGPHIWPLPEAPWIRIRVGEEAEIGRASC